MGIGYMYKATKPVTHAYTVCVGNVCVCVRFVVCICMAFAVIGMSVEGSVEGIKGEQRIIEICSYRARYSIA